MKTPKSKFIPSAKFEAGQNVLVFDGPGRTREVTITSREFFAYDTYAGWVYSHTGGEPNHGESMYAPLP